MQKLSLLFLCLAFGLVACDGESSRSESSPFSKNQTVEATAHDEFAGEPSGDAYDKAVENVVVYNTDIPTADKNHPKEKYLNINQGFNGQELTYLNIAYLKEKFTKEDILSYLSPQYYNEKDGFKKRDIADKEHPVIEKKIENIKSKNKYFYVPMSDGHGSISNAMSLALNDNKKADKDVLKIGAPTLEKYDFDISAFPIRNPMRLQRSQQDDCWSGFFGNSQGFGIKINNTYDLPCYFKVKDELKARKIESLIAEMNVKISGKIYLFIYPNATQKTLEAEVVGVDMGAYNRETNEFLSENKMWRNNYE